MHRTKTNFRFPGQYYIEETGLYYNWWRWYKSEAGRYIQIDLLRNATKRFSLTENELGYLYVLGNPVFYYDVEGLKKRPSDKCGFIAPDCVPKHQIDTPEQWCYDNKPKGPSKCWLEQCLLWAGASRGKVKACDSDKKECKR
ncbi:MAG: RHS repeat-associated core domain-containing protein [Deltaproteobacteria bacterium]|nr:RHS repeat-associated core domain-containing protein [Deltaproteobacteria bacterium]